jgi:hypothetical protein
MGNERYVRYEIVPRERRPSTSPGLWLDLAAGSTRIQWVLYFSDRPTLVNVERQVRLAMETVRRMPASHLSVLDAILIVQRLPGGRATGGGYWKDTEVGRWYQKERRTGVPDADIRWHTSRYRRARAGIIAITRHAILRDIFRYSVLHEIAHSVDHHLGLIPRGATLNDFRGVRYPRPRIGEYAAEAYSRFIFNANGVCRRGNVPGTENMRSCSQRLIRVLRNSPAFASLPRDWMPG